MTKPLTDSEYLKSKPQDKDYMLFDGGGLFLLVKPAGKKICRFKYKKPSGKAGLISVGPYPEISLAVARRTRDEYRYFFDFVTTLHNFDAQYNLLT